MKGLRIFEVPLVPDDASGVYGFEVAAAAAAAAAVAACCFLLCSSALWTSAILCASAAAAAWCNAIALCACAACIDDIIDSDSAAGFDPGGGKKCGDW